MRNSALKAIDPTGGKLSSLSDGNSALELAWGKGRVWLCRRRVRVGHLIYSGVGHEAGLDGVVSIAPVVLSALVLRFHSFLKFSLRKMLLLVQ